MSHRRRFAGALLALFAPVIAAAAQFVGSTTCLSCHVQEATAWRESHHAQAMQSADRHTVLGDFSGSKPPGSDGIKRLFTRGSGYFAQIELPGRPVQDYAIRYTFGVYPLQQYLIELPGGRLQALSTAWDARPVAQGGQRWFSLHPEGVKPGDPLHWTGRDSNWNFMCAACHSTNLRKNYSAQGDRYRTSWSDLDVACEACHGPGSDHLQWARSASHPAGDKGLGVALHANETVQWGFWSAGQRIASPKGAVADARMQAAVCFPCHARRQALGDGAPVGQPLLDNYLPQLIEPGVYHADGQIDAEDFEFGSFVQSRMSEAGVTCTNCHDAHSLKLKAPGNAVCTQCHQAASYDVPAHHHHRPQSEGSRCISCHMPQKTYMGVDPRRDHGFRLPLPALTAAIGTPNACNQCHTDRSAAWAVDALKSWPAHDAAANHFATVFDDAWSGAAVTPALLKVLSQPLAPIVRGTALALLPAQSDAPSPAVSVAVAQAVADRDALVRLGAARALAALPPPLALQTGAALLIDPVKAVRVEAARSLADAADRNTPAALRSRLNVAVQELIGAELASAERPEAHVNVAQIRIRLGQGAQAEQELDTALKLDPRFVPAMVNLADLYRSQQRESDAQRWLRRAVAVAPEAAEPAHALGLLEVRAGHGAEAMQWLRKAVALAPSTARYSYVYVVALAESGQRGEAARVLKEARRHAPKDESLKSLEQQLVP